MVITAALSIQDPRERPMEKKQAADEHRRFEDKDSDFLAFVNLWNYLKSSRMPGQQPVPPHVPEGFSPTCGCAVAGHSLPAASDGERAGFKANHERADFKTVHCALLTGLLSHIGNKDLEKPEFLGARNGRFHLFPASGLFKPPKWVMAAELVETSRLYARINAKIEPEWVEPLAGHLIKLHHSDPTGRRKTVP